MLNAAVSRHMQSVQDYRDRLAALQGTWDTLSLLSHLSGDGTDINGTRRAFESLTAELVRNLGTETYKKSLLALKAKSQIAIDVIVRNLYERTADIGFLCTDGQIRQFLRESRSIAGGAADPAHGERLRRRFREYVAKYSVYHDIVLLAPDGKMLLRLDERAAVDHSRDALVAETLSTRAGYVETFRRVDFLPGHERSLVYSFRVCEGAQTTGVLCLCFGFDAEVAGIFAKLSEDKLREESEWTVFAFLDEDGRVIATSDAWQLPIGAPMTPALDENGRLIRFAGREYLAITRRTQGYQGYMGPGWYGHAMVPLEHAFERAEGEAASRIPEQLLAELRQSQAIFSETLRQIPQQADRIQRELNRAVWNGNLRLAAGGAANSNFSKVLLREIGNAGRRTQDMFRHSIGDLQEMVVSSILQDAQLLAVLAVDILDRNLYERANDCRWWALDATLIGSLAAGMPDRSEITQTLQHIHSLYTVYHDLIVFDASHRIVAVSNPASEHRIGAQAQEDWVARTLALRSSQEFAVSEFAPSEYYDDRHTLVFGATVRSEHGRTIGGIGIVFDSEPQLTAMLRDALPRDEAGVIAAGCIGLFVDADLRVVAATSDYRPGDRLDLPRDFLTSAAEQPARIVACNGTHYAVGAQQTTGYREYAGMGVYSLVMIPLGPVATGAASATQASKQNSHRRQANEQVIDIATFCTAQQWLGLLREQVVEAVDGGHLRPVPGSPAWHAGLLMYRDLPVPVIDLARLTGNPASAERRDVVITRVPGSDQLLGLLIDELADIPEVPASRIVPVTELLDSGTSAIVDRAVRPDQPDDPVLFIVDLEQLLLQVRYAKEKQPAPGRKNHA